MSLFEPFGVGNLLVYGSFAKVADHVVPNEVATGDPGALLRKLSDHPTVPQYLSRPTFERKSLALAKVPFFGFPAPIDAVFLEGGKVIACQATLEGTPHCFLGQRLRHKLRKDDESIVRNYGPTCFVVLDTRRTPFDLTAPSMKRDELEEFHEDRRGYDGQTSDFVTARARGAGLVHGLPGRCGDRRDDGGRHADPRVLQTLGSTFEGLTRG